jgi:hypothetical protein
MQRIKVTGKPGKRHHVGFRNRAARRRKAGVYFKFVKSHSTIIHGLL